MTAYLSLHDVEAGGDMDEKVIDGLVDEVLKRLRKKVLIVLTNAGGYKDEIYTRLSQCDRFSFSVMITDDAHIYHSEEKWGRMGEVIKPSADLLPAILAKYDGVLVPFMDFATMGEIANGLFCRDGAKTINYALMRAMTVVALDYNCNPQSELNQILGMASDAPHLAQIENNRKILIASGIQFCSANEMEQRLLIPSVDEQEQGNNDALSYRYITLNDVMNNHGGYDIHSDARLTDLATEYLKSNKK
ncbi:Uncharacterised protein [Pragia fontium]|uniref:hypothetical protein n=1 Tax=Pragia fontium TaxID=82985 RepID=UPI000E012E41|nr:hypothetical protein [Pragia fontium]SUB82863.1 Uncharacterised protein [Pragia fontium]